jgi:hypothetical protein
MQDAIKPGMTFKNDWREVMVVSEPEHGVVEVENMTGETETMFVQDVIEIAGF